MTNVGRKEFKHAKKRRQADAKVARKKVSDKKPKAKRPAKAPGKRRTGKPS
jgi:hypothetical protein